MTLAIESNLPVERVRQSVDQCDELAILRAINITHLNFVRNDPRKLDFGIHGYHLLDFGLHAASALSMRGRRSWLRQLTWLRSLLHSVEPMMWPCAWS